MKILYISPENTVGTLSTWKKAHEARGNTCDFITLYRSKHQYDPGICLDLPLINTQSWYLKGRHRYYQHYRGQHGDQQEREGFPPTWKPNSFLEQLYFQFRDWIWHFKIEPAIEQYGLMNYDVYHFEWGMGLYRDGRFVERLAKAGKPIICTYHGQDMRSRGVIPAVDRLSILNLTSELDLLQKHPSIQYLFLPYDTSQFSPRTNVSETIRICHSPTNRYYKGSETIIPVCEQIAEENDHVEFSLIENTPHEETIHIKQTSDILVDQIYNRGGWGYGMNSIEALSLGLCCATELIPDYEEFIPDHPFVNINENNLYTELTALVNNTELLREMKKRSAAWVEQYHNLHNVAETLYRHYEKLTGLSIS